MAKSTKTKKTTLKKMTASKKSQTKIQSTVEEMPVVNSFKIKKLYVVLILCIFVLGIILYYARGIFVAAIVNGQPISRVFIIKETEKQSGKQALDTIIRNTLIRQEARKQNISVTEKEIDEEIKKVEGTLSKQGQKLDDVLTMQGMTRQDLRKLIELDKLVGKVVGKDVVVSDKEVDEYLEKNKDLLPKDQTIEQLRKSAMERLKQDKLNEKVQNWLESLRNKAKILYFVQY